MSAGYLPKAGDKLGMVHADCLERMLAEKRARTLAQAAAAMGRVGGAAGRGAAKIRGDAAYYRACQLAGVPAQVASRKANAEARMRAISARLAAAQREAAVARLARGGETAGKTGSANA